MTTDHDAGSAHADLAEHVARWVELFNARDPAALDGLYEPDAVVVPQPGHPVTGADRSAALAEFMGLGVPMKAALRQAYIANDIALLVIDWSLTGTGPDGREIDLSGTATDVVRRSADGQWRYVIDNPSGAVT
ncbi:nuclear transport factor 2 family protein [Nocardia sp. NPDC051756]|uniref:YybH family protein n=1 Tax=Nocardia sp. NPDC051756 TaxID=3154751 RepID=UPI003431F1C8